MALKIGFEITGGDAWKAGVSYPNYLSHALMRAHGDAFKCCLVNRIGHGEASNDFFGDGLEVVTIPRSRRWDARWRAARLMRNAGIDALFGLGLRRRYGTIKILSWIPDFQHLHLPEMFSRSERELRDRDFKRTAEIAHKIILMSETVRRDFERILPNYAHKARVLTPVHVVPDFIYEANPQSVLESFHLPEKFVFLPGQFWKHKNHETVVEALSLLTGKGINVFIVCTGYPGDYRHPNYFTDLCQKISQKGVRNHVAFLGLVSREIMLLLIRQSVCVLNPSLFEGFGLTVEEARSVGKRVLLSDIAAHREQDPPKAVFFDPHNCEDLALKLDTIWSEAKPGPDLDLEFSSRRSESDRLRASAESFKSVLLEAS